MKISHLLLSLATAALVASPLSAADTWTIDTRHSGVNFAVRNFFVPVEGSFKIKEGTIEFDGANLAACSVSAVIAVDTVNTQDADRDGHLKKADFFLVETFPTASFKSTKWEKTGENTYKVAGDLTIKDVTKPITLTVTFLGSGPGNRGRTVSGWQATTKINRKDFGVAYGPSIADEVSITINIQGMLKSNG
jgi:polyisoprenoid-binding protein YceI